MKTVFSLVSTIVSAGLVYLAFQIAHYFRSFYLSLGYIYKKKIGFSFLVSLGLMLHGLLEKYEVFSLKIIGLRPEKLLYSLGIIGYGVYNMYRIVKKASFKKELKYRASLVILLLLVDGIFKLWFLPALRLDARIAFINLKFYLVILMVPILLNLILLGLFSEKHLLDYVIITFTDGSRYKVDDIIPSKGQIEILGDQGDRRIIFQHDIRAIDYIYRQYRN